VTTQDHDESNAPPDVRAPEAGGEPAGEIAGEVAGEVVEPDDAPPEHAKVAAVGSDEEPDEDAVRQTPRWREFVPPGGDGPLFDPEGLLFGEPAG